MIKFVVLALAASAAAAARLEDDRVMEKPMEKMERFRENPMERTEHKDRKNFHDDKAMPRSMLQEDSVEKSMKNKKDMPHQQQPMAAQHEKQMKNIHEKVVPYNQHPMERDQEIALPREHEMAVFEKQTGLPAVSPAPQRPAAVYQYPAPQYQVAGPAPRWYQSYPAVPATAYHVSPAMPVIQTPFQHNMYAAQPAQMPIMHTRMPVVEAPLMKAPIMKAQVYALPAQPSQESTHHITNYHDAELYTAQSNGQFAPMYISKNGAVEHQFTPESMGGGVVAPKYVSKVGQLEHVVKREAEKEEELAPVQPWYSHSLYNNIKPVKIEQTTAPFTTTYSNVAPINYKNIAPVPFQHVANPLTSTYTHMSPMTSTYTNIAPMASAYQSFAPFTYKTMAPVSTYSQVSPLATTFRQLALPIAPVY